MATGCKTQACRDAHARTGGRKQDGRRAPKTDQGQDYDFGEDLLDTYAGVHSDAHDFFMSIFNIEDSDGSALGDGSSSSTTDASDSWLAALLGGMAASSGDTSDDEDTGLTATQLSALLESYGESQDREETASGGGGGGGGGGSESVWSRLESWARDNPIATGAAMAAGAYLWTRR